MEATMNYNYANCATSQSPITNFDGTLLAQKALSAIMRTNQQVSSYGLICILRGISNEDIMKRGYQQLRTFGVGRDISYDDWQDYLKQMRTLGLIEVDYRFSRNLRITEAGLDVLYGRMRITLQVIERKEDSVLFDKLVILRQQIADDAKVPVTWILSDDSLHAMALRKPKTLNAFKYTPGVGEAKQNQYGQAFVELIVNHSNPRNTLTINGQSYEIPLDLWSCMPWREAINKVKSIHYWNFYEPKTVQISEIISSTILPKEREPEVLSLFFRIIKEAFQTECAGNMLFIPKRQEYDCNGNPVATLQCESFEDGMLQFQTFVDENHHYPLSEGNAYECSLRRWYQEVGHGYIETTKEQRKAFEQLKDKYADIPKNRVSWEKKQRTGNNSANTALK